MLDILYQGFVPLLHAIVTDHASKHGDPFERKIK